MANKSENLQKLREADDIQNKTKDSVFRMQKNAAETEQLGIQTLEVLREQNHQLDTINQEVDGLDGKLDTSAELQKSFDHYNFNWGGGKKASAVKESNAEIKRRHSEGGSGKIREVFQNEKFSQLTRSWYRDGLVLCSDTSVDCSSVFDPDIQNEVENTHWKVDMTLSEIDECGWTYAFDYAHLNKHGSGTAEKGLTSCVRRRKWRFVENKGVDPAMNSLKERNDARHHKPSPPKNEEKNGYVPRSKQVDTTLTTTALTASNPWDQVNDLDEESRAGLERLEKKDEDIDQGLDSVGQTIDHLGSIAHTMNTETKEQNGKIDKLGEKMEDVIDKTTEVKARSKWQLSGV